MLRPVLRQDTYSEWAGEACPRLYRQQNAQRPGEVHYCHAYLAACKSHNTTEQPLDCKKLLGQLLATHVGVLVAS
jgi:hypothetical protein